MAFHTTSMRAKEALRSFRRRSGAARQERSTSTVPRLQVDDPLSTVESTSEGESRTSPEMVVSEDSEDKDTGEEEGTKEEEGVVEDDEEETTVDVQERVSSEPEESNKNDSEVEVEEIESQEPHSLQT